MRYHIQPLAYNYIRKHWGTIDFSSASNVAEHLRTWSQLTDYWYWIEAGLTPEQAYVNTIRQDLGEVATFRGKEQS